MRTRTVPPVSELQEMRGRKRLWLQFQRRAKQIVVGVCGLRRVVPGVVRNLELHSAAIAHRDAARRDDHLPTGLGSYHYSSPYRLMYSLRNACCARLNRVPMDAGWISRAEASSSYVSPSLRSSNNSACLVPIALKTRRTFCWVSLTALISSGVDGRLAS